MTQRDSRRRYSLTTAICLIMGICIGSGIFFKSDNVLVATGGSIGLGVVMFCLAATYIVFGGLCLTLFAARTDRAGGLVDYAERFVSPRFARLVGWHYSLVYLPSIAAVIFWVAGVYACMVLGLEGTLAQQLGIGLLALLVCSVTNAVAPRLSGWAQNALTLVKVAPLVVVGVIGATLVVGGGVAPAPAHAARGADGVAWLAAAAPIAFAFDGWPAATSIAPELRRAQRNLPIALVVAPIWILALYLAYFVGISLALGPETVMESGDASLSMLFVRLLGPRAAVLPNLIALLAVLGTGNGLVLSLQRLLRALVQRGDLPGCRVAREGAPEGGPSARLGALLATGSVLAWTAVHAAVHAAGLIPNGDVSEVSVCLTMLLMLPYFVVAWRMRDEGRAGRLRGRVAPVLACACCLVVGLSGLAEPVRLAFAAAELAVPLALALALRRGGGAPRPLDGTR